MRQVTARYFFRLKYHQGYWQACLDIEAALRRLQVPPKERMVVRVIREWAKEKLRAWDDSPDKKDWRNDRPPECPVMEVVEQVRATKDPDKADVAPFLEPGFESVMSFLGMEEVE